VKVLILGVVGMLGHMAHRVFSKHHETYATCREPYEDNTLIHPFVDKQHCFDNVNVLNSSGMKNLLQKLQPQVIINGVGVIKQKKESKDPIPSLRVNSLFPHELAQLADEVGAKMIQISTDCVFSGRQGMYTEDSPEDPVDIYGRTKLLGEVTRAPHLTLRTSFVGRQLRDSVSLFEWFIAQRNGQAKGFKYAIYSGLTSQALSEVLLQIVDKHPALTGLYNVASEPINKYDLLGRLNDLMQLNIQLAPETQFHCDRSLNGQRFTAQTGITVPSWEAMLSQFVADAPNYETWRKAQG
jgi:dTDP-4-dehydrorhamnose reductase